MLPVGSFFNSSHSYPPAFVQWPGPVSHRVRIFSDTRIPSFPTVRFEGMRPILTPVAEAGLEG